MNGTYTAVLDRIAGGVNKAVLLIEEEGETIDEIVLDVEELPKDGQHKRAIFDVRIREGKLIEAEYKPEQEEKRLKKAQEWLDENAISLDELDPDDI